MEEGDRLLTLKSVLKTEKYYFGFTYQVLDGLEIYKDQSLLEEGLSGWKTEAQISIRAESLHFNEKEQKYKRESRTHFLLQRVEEPWLCGVQHWC